jgi:uncharacterized membrane protein
MQWKGGTTGMFLDDFRVSNLICHRIPERTFNIRGIYFPVCARCTGFYMGAFSYFIYAYFFYIDYTIYLVALAILMMIPAFLDGFTQLGGLRMSNNTLRLLTGLLGGVGLAIVVKAIKWVVITSL